MAKNRCLGCMEEYENSPVCPYCGFAKNQKQEDLTFLPAGTIINARYLVGKALGSSDFTVTYIAWDLQNQKSVVIKEYFPRSLASRVPETLNLNTYDGDRADQFENGLKGYLQEANLLLSASSNLPGIVKTIDIFIENSTGYAVTEYVEGVSLDKIIAQERMPWNDVVEIILPVINSLHIMHQMGIINYIIAPDNIIMTVDGEIKITSFGASRFETVGEKKDLGMITKPGFSAEELYHSDAKATAASDVYSIAAVMYYAITGVIPQVAIERYSADNLRHITSYGIAIPKNIEDAILNALNVSAKSRTQSCKILFDELTGQKKVTRIVEKKKKEDTGKMSAKTKGFLIALVALGVALICAIIFVFGSKNIENNSKNNIGDGKTVSNFVGMSYYEAYNYMTSLGWKVKFTRADDSTEKYASDTVIKQDVPADSLLSDFNEEDKVIIFVISEQESNEINDYVEKSDWVLMPNVEGLSQSAAHNLLKKYGFSNIETREEYSNQPEGTVIRQSKSVDAQVEKDVSIIITVAKEPTTQPPTRQPSGNGGSSNTNKPTSPPAKEQETGVGVDGIDIF